MKQARMQKRLGNFISFVLAIGLVATSLGAYVQADAAPEADLVSAQTAALVEPPSALTEASATIAVLETELASEETQPATTLSPSTATTALAAESEPSLAAAVTEPLETFAESNQNTEPVPAGSETAKNTATAMPETETLTTTDSGTIPAESESETTAAEPTAAPDETTATAEAETTAAEAAESEIAAADNPDHLSAPLTLLTPEILRITAPMLRSAARLSSQSNLEPGEVSVSKTATPVTGKVNTWDIELTVSGRGQSKNL
ncbi:MAG: hypothetical protein PHR21_06330 [Oscillospiraceae bacterium]|nr:hypothetical protein [Oscillospiraceae bacterium]